MDFMTLNQRGFRAFALSSALVLTAATAFGQAYTYRAESFEGDEWTNKNATKVTSSTGEWTTNKNISDATYAQDGTKSLHIAQKAGFITPELTEGVGAIVYWEHNANRQVTVEVSSDGTTWRAVDSFKTTADWTKHTVMVNDATVRWVRFSQTSNKNFYVDNFLITKTDGRDADGNVIVTTLTLPYFVNDFEHSFFPQTKDEAASEKTYDVAGQGEWRYLNAYKNTNEQYIPDGSARGLRILKNGGYVVTPVLSQGLVKVMFDGGRTGKKLNLYVSKDAGATWDYVKEIVVDAKNEIYVGDQEVNRVKLINETSSDNDIDNLSVTAFPGGTPATVVTGDASDITSSSATVHFDLTDQGSGAVTETGVCWNTTGEPTIDDNTARETLNRNFVTVTGLPASSTVYYRAYAVSLAGVAYGETKTLQTSAPSAPVIATGTVDIDDARTDEEHFYVAVTATLTDNGGLDVTEAGVVYSTNENPTVTDTKAKGNLVDGKLTVFIPLLPDTKYYFRAYAVNEAGTGYGEQVAYQTGAIVVPEYAHNVYYCDPAGDDATADGSIEKPFRSLQKAHDLALPGDTIYMNAGTYSYSARINLSRHGEKNSGRICLFSRGGRAVLDFSSMATADANQGIRMSSSYWHVYGLDICGAGDNGMLIERNKPSGGSYADIAANVDQAHDNIIENCSFYRNKDTGLQLKNLAAYNLIINCDSYFNCDPGEGNADGFAVKLSHGEGNYFYGCRAWNNSDDGWDQFIKKEGGFPDDITTTLEYCWAFHNGYLENDQSCSGNGNGFKMGSNEGRNNIIMNRCMAFENLNKSFDQNHNTGHMILNNCSGYASKDLTGKSRYSYRLDEATASGHIIRLTNCVAISDGISDRKKSEYAPWSVSGEMVTCDMNCLPADFQSIDWEQGRLPRQADGSLPAITFLKPVEGSDRFADRGSAVASFEGESRWAEGIVFNGAAPDLGYWESGESNGIARIEASRAGCLSVVQTLSGLVLLTLEGAEATDLNVAEAYDATGRLVARKAFNGPTTSLTLPAGVAIIRVGGQTLRILSK